MLEDVYKTYKASAEVINWKSYNQNELFFEYIKHENDELGEHFYAGIVCRFWGYSGRLYTQCNKHVPFEQCYDTLLDAINYVLKKRVWENPGSSLYKDPTAPDKAFHIALKRQRSILLANLTAQKRQSNFNTMSMEGIKEEYADAAEGLFNINGDNHDLEDLQLIELIKTFNPVSIILLDMICFSSWVNIKNVALSAKKLEFTKDSRIMFEYYNTKYGMSEEDYNKAVLACQCCSSNRLISEIKKSLYIIRKEHYND